MSGLSSPGIFLSYRRKDTGPYARLLQRDLRERFPDTLIFMDLDSIEVGARFGDAIRQAVDSCAAQVALIGREWVTLTDDEGHRRLDDPNDWVRFEVAEALRRGVLVIPVLVDGARPPRQQQLPTEIQELAQLNALELSISRYDFDTGLLFDAIQRVLAERTVAASSVEERVLDLAKKYNTLRETMPSGDQRTVTMADVVRELRNLLREVPDFDVAKYLSSADRGERLAAYAYLMEHKALRYRPQLVRVACAEDKPFGQYTGLEAIRYQGQTAERLGDEELRLLSSLAQRLGPREDRTQLANDIIALERSKR